MEPISKTNLIEDLKAIFKRDKVAMLRVAKNNDYFKIGLGLYALVQVGTVLQQWLTVRSSYVLMESLGIHMDGFGPLDMLKQGVFGFIMGLALMVIVYFVATKLFKGKEDVDLKGFMTIYCFVISPMMLVFVPVLGFLVLIWALVMFFTMMNAVFGFSGWKTLGVALVAVLGWAIISGPLGMALGVNSGFSTDFSFDF